MTTDEAEYEDWGGALNAELKRAEEAIRVCRFGVSADVALEYELRLVFGKTNGKWSLFIRNHGAVMNILTEASVTHRMLVAKALPRLVQQLRQNRAHQLVELEHTVLEVREYLDRLESEL